jgi:CRP-like cAMP-binding protein
LTTTFLAALKSDLTEKGSHLKLAKKMVDLDIFIRSQIKVSDERLSAIMSEFDECSFDKEKFLIKKEQIVENYYFIKSGALRFYVYHNDQEVTVWLAFEGEFFTELNSLKYGRPTQFYVQAIEPCTLMVIKKYNMEGLYQIYPEWQQFGRQVWENAFLKITGAIINYQTMTAEERYMELIKQSDAVKRVPLKQLASFLGITQTSLSRLRRKIAQ